MEFCGLRSINFGLKCKLFEQRTRFYKKIPATNESCLHQLLYVYWPNSKYVVQERPSIVFHKIFFKEDSNDNNISLSTNKSSLNSLTSMRDCALFKRPEILAKTLGFLGTGVRILKKIAEKFGVFAPNTPS
jgi:hypothetical protein